MPARILIVCGVLAFARSASAYPVEALPSDNLLTNPWFRSAQDPNVVGFDGWERSTVGGDLIIGGSQKSSNPSPDSVLAGACGGVPEFCGTGLRWAEDRSAGCNLDRVGLDAYASQVVAADSTHRFLSFSTYWVAHRVGVIEVIVSGSDSPEGPWQEIWRPLQVSSPDTDLAGQAPGTASGADRCVEWAWVTCGADSCAACPAAPKFEAQVESGYANYKVELHTRYPDLTEATCDVGIKVTGIYFSTAADGESEALADAGAVGAQDAGTDTAADGDDLSDSGACACQGGTSRNDSWMTLLVLLGLFALSRHRARGRSASV